MKLAFVLFYSSLVFAAPSIVTPLPVEGAGCNENSSGNTLALVTGNSVVTAGDMLVIVVSGLADGVTSITNGAGTAGDVWHILPGIADGSADGTTSIIYSYNISGAASGGANVTVVSNVANTFIGACIAEVTGVLTTDPIDSHASADDTGSNEFFTTPLIQGNTQPEMFFAVSTCFGTGNQTTPEGGIQFTELNGALNGVGGCPGGWYVSSVTGAIQAGFRADPAGPAAVQIASFKATGAPGGATTMIPSVY